MSEKIEKVIEDKHSITSSDIGIFDASKLVISPFKFVVMVVGTFGFYTFYLSYKFLGKSYKRLESWNSFLSQIISISRERNTAPFWSAEKMAIAISSSYWVFLVILFLSGGIWGHGHSGGPFYYHLPPIAFVAIVPIFILLFLIIKTINETAGDPKGESNNRYNLFEIGSIFLTQILSYLLLKYGVNDQNSGIFSILFSAFK